MRYRATLADALDLMVRLAYLNRHTTITCTTPDCLEVIRMWGQIKDLP